MTDITDDDLFDLATKSGVFALFSESGYRMARAGDPLALDRLRRFAELARQDERAKCIAAAVEHLLDVEGDDRDIANGIRRARGSDK